MRILYITPAYKPSFATHRKRGGDISNRLLMQGLSRSGHEVCVFSMQAIFGESSYRDTFAVFEPPKTTEFKFLNFSLGLLLCRYRLRKLVQSFSPEVILSSTTMVSLATEISRRVGVPSGAIVRAMENFPTSDEYRPSILGQIDRFLHRITVGDYGSSELRDVDFIITNSEYMKSRVQIEIGADQVYVVYPPINAELKPLISTRKIRRVMMVGESEEKGAPLFRDIAKRLPHIEFLIVGAQHVRPGSVAEAGNLKEVGWTDDIENRISESDIVLVPSQWEEPFGRIAVESLALGKLVLVADKGGLPETVGFQQDLIVPSSCVDAWESRIREVESRPEVFQNALNMARLSLTNFWVHTQIQRLEKLLGVEVGRNREL